jgi:MmyB-like transcription regulator ligand binding domain
MMGKGCAVIVDVFAPHVTDGRAVSSRPSVQRILDSMTTTPAYVRNGRMDILAANRLGRALFAPILTSPAQPANAGRFLACWAATLDEAAGSAPGQPGKAR